MNIGENLIKARKAKGLSQEDVANELNVSRQSVSLWETDQTVPTIDNLVTLSKLYGVNVSILLGQEEEEPKPRNTNLNYFSNSNNNGYEAVLQNEKNMKERQAIKLKEYKQLSIISMIFLILAVLNPDYLLITMVLALISFICASLAKKIKNNNFTLFLFIVSMFYLIYSFIDIIIKVIN